MTLTNVEQIRAAVGVMLVVADAIHELKHVPAGQLYATLIGHMSLATMVGHMSLDNYEAIIRALVHAGVVKRDAHMLHWVSPNDDTHAG